VVLLHHIEDIPSRKILSSTLGPLAWMPPNLTLLFLPDRRVRDLLDLPSAPHSGFSRAQNFCHWIASSVSSSPNNFFDCSPLPPLDWTPHVFLFSLGSGFSNAASPPFLFCPRFLFFVLLLLFVPRPESPTLPFPCQIIILPLPPAGGEGISFLYLFRKPS